MAEEKLADGTESLSSQKKFIFYLITFSIPILFFVGLEATLRATGYMGNLDLFQEVNVYGTEYKIPNPKFSARYFFYTRTIPTASTDAFLKEKPEDGYRVFAMGGSSAAGYPYGFNGLFSRVMQDALTDALPDRTVEVVNVGISAVNSYTLFDQVDEIIAEDPDAIVIYAGHNEFYGALGVGSNENLGGFPGFVRFYLKIQRFKTFLLLRNMIVNSGKWFATTFSGEKIDQSATLMERIVDSRSIELNDPKYELAKIQFESNMRAIVKKFEDAGIEVMIGSVVSNLKDHFPFVSIENGAFPPAEQVYREGYELLAEGDSAAALEKFILAKDLDGLKFRAPSEMNKIIKKITEETKAYYVPIEERFKEESPQGLIGFNLMLEHLHPNDQGYFLIGKTFAQKFQDLDYFIETDYEIIRDWDIYDERRLLSDYDHRIAWHRVKTLKQGWPFVTSGPTQRYQDNYIVESSLDSLAFLAVHGDLSWDQAKVKLAEIYTNKGKTDEAIYEYQGLIRNQPWNNSPYIFAARLELDRNNLDAAEPYLRKAYEINEENAFITKMLGAVELNNGNVDIAIELLEQSVELEPNDPQTLYNLSGAYGIKKDYKRAQDIILRALQISPNFPGAKQWYDQLDQLIKR